MALSVKAYINPDTNQQEIRRFAIDEGASANYDYLRQKIEQVFPSVRGKAFKLFWKGKLIDLMLVFTRSSSRTFAAINPFPDPFKATFVSSKKSCDRLLSKTILQEAVNILCKFCKVTSSANMLFNPA